MGRPPSIKIDKNLLHNLRERDVLTQQNVAEKIGVHVVTYQSIESSGKTSKQTAQKLADFFGVSLENLQQGIEYPDTADYLRQIEKSIRDALSQGGNSALEQALQLTLENTRFGSDSHDENRDDAIRYLAQDIAQRIEAVQLIRNKNEIATLSELTGLAETELLRPANVEGHWFINVSESWKTDPNAPPEEFNIRSEVIQRANWAVGTIKEAIEKNSRNLPESSDESIKLSHDGFWYKVEVKLSLRKTIRIDLVRCQPDTKGLRWVKPSRRDKYLIRDPLRYWARENFNFVCDFDGKQSPSGDIRQLRFLITEYNQSSPGASRPTGKMVIYGNLGEMCDELVASLREQDRTHFLVQNWLTNDLKCALAPLLADYPRECWSLHGSVIDLDENKSKGLKRPFLERYWGRKYDIELVEQVEGQFRPVPWREKDRELFQKSIQEMLGNPNDPAWTTNEPRRTFEPFSAES
jgi:DNA-binding XRE family transcriptional regulator